MKVAAEEGGEKLEVHRSTSVLIIRSDSGRRS